MIAKLTGRLDSAGNDWAILDVGGVGYLVFCSRRTLTALGQAGAAAALLVDTHVREDHIHLYGFATKAEQDWFRLLLTVQGVGGRVALAVLSALSADELAQAIAAQDRTMLSRADGVGPKLASRIALELKDKAAGLAMGGALAASAALATPVTAGPLADAVSALVNLGYRRAEAYSAVVAARGQLGEATDTAALIRGGLKELSP